MKNIITGVFGVLAILGALAFFGLTPFGRQMVQEVVGSPVGTTFNTKKVSDITFSLSGATSTSVLNPTGQMMYVDNVHVACNTVGTSKTAYTGAGLASLTMLIGTSSTANPTPFSPAAEIANLTIATSTPNFLLSSSTAQTATSSYAIQWPAATYMTFVTNATNTAVCTVGTGLIGS